MKQIPVGFSQKIEEKLRQNAQKRNISLAHYVRELVEIGLQVEEAAANLSQKNTTELRDNDLQKDVWKKTLAWLLESRYLARYLVEQSSEDKQKIKYILETAKEKSEAFVNGMFNEQIQ